ncbi:hypothetical protein [Paenibacillus sp. XY044]|uniref:hypothetical protein n=1 Tax=Paenibacillus sp. XY044 TaxID=2026089 RepID=UPI000B97F465|nr:hypothetical protein [Paenibacillus sp. XY044]OZB96806.1 hypothetical protein CJP46_13235 [Paenibacillus sp. XY044]
MNPKVSVYMKISTLVMALTLTACSSSTEPSVTPETSVPVNEEATSPEAGNEPSPESAPETENEPNPESTRPPSEIFDLMTGEGNQSYTATLQQGEGFSLYVFEKFTFDEAKGRLFLSSHPEYDVDIEMLPANYDLTQLAAAGKKELDQFGEVSDYSGELVEHPLGSAKLYLQVSSGEGIHDYIVWESETGDAFLFRLRNPKGEEASDFAGPVLVSLSTVQRDS